MKRSREDNSAPLTTAAFSYQSPLRLTPQRTAWGGSHAGSAGGSSACAAEITPIKRQRDRSVPMDALSRLMTAATSAARMKKRAQMTLTSLFGGGNTTKAPLTTGNCAVCAVATTATAMPQQRQTNTTHVPAVPPLPRCAHCERAMGECCARECDACGHAFCSLCSTINCDEQYDRVFCLSCNYDVSR